MMTAGSDSLSALSLLFLVPQCGDYPKVVDIYHRTFSNSTLLICIPLSLHPDVSCIHHCPYSVFLVATNCAKLVDMHLILTRERMDFHPWLCEGRYHGPSQQYELGDPNLFHSCISFPG